MEKRQILLTAVGPDRSGLVEEIASVIHDGGANLEDSRMAVLAGDFALIVLFSGSAGALERVQRDLKAASEGLKLQMNFREPTPPLSDRAGSRISLEVNGMDQPGIVHRIGGILARLGINVESLESRFKPAAFHGTEMFSLHAELHLPQDFDLDTLQTELDRACAEMHLGYDLSGVGED